MERHFYISRSHNCLQGVGAAVPVEDGIIVMYTTRTSTDQVSVVTLSAVQLRIDNILR